MASRARNSFGFSLIGLVTGIAITSIVLLATAYVLVQTKSTEVKFDLQSDLDRAHLLSLQKTRSVKYLKRYLALNPIAAQNQNGAKTNSAMLACLGRNGTSCQSGMPQAYIQIPNASSTAKCSAGPNCAVNSVVEYKMDCSSQTSCEALEVRFTSSFVHQATKGVDDLSFRTRVNVVKIPGVLFADKAAIKFNCTTNNVLTEIDFDNLVAVCAKPAPNSCPNNAPLKSYQTVAQSGGTICPPVVAQPCPNGVKTVGLFGGQVICR